MTIYLCQKWITQCIFISVVTIYLLILSIMIKILHYLHTLLYNNGNTYFECVMCAACIAYRDWSMFACLKSYLKKVILCWQQINLFCLAKNTYIHIYM